MFELLEIFLQYYNDYYEMPIKKRYNRLRYLKWRYNRVMNERFEEEIIKN